MNYDESEARDERGRWTSGGGGNSSSIRPVGSRAVKKLATKGASKPEIVRTSPDSYEVRVKGKRVGGADVVLAPAEGGRPYLSGIRIDPEFRRRGFATALYDRIEADLGEPLAPSKSYISPEAQAVRDARAKRNK